VPFIDSSELPSNELLPGPVYADPADPTNIDINWDRFVADGGVNKFRSDDADERRSAGERPGNAPPVPSLHVVASWHATEG
jgi:hypothetical protein